MDRPVERASAASLRANPIGDMVEMEIQNNRDKFFQCSPKEIVGERKFHFDEDSKRFGFHLTDQDIRFASSCVKEAILDRFAHSAQTITDFSQHFKANKMSKALLYAAKLLSLVPTEYPTPFDLAYLKSQLKSEDMDKLLSFSQFGGKPDDITVVAGLIVEKDASVETRPNSLDNFKEEVEKARTSVYSDFQKDIIHFYENANLRKIIKKMEGIEDSDTEDNIILI